MRKLVTVILLTASALVAPISPAASATPAPAATAAPAPQPDDIEVTDLPAGLQPRGLDDRGRVLGLLAGDVVVVDDGATTDIGPWDPFPNPLCPSGPICFWPTSAAPIVNDRGVVATSLGRHATLWDEGETTDLNGDAAGSWVLDLNDRGAALVTRFTADHQRVGLWDDGEVVDVGAGTVLRQSQLHALTDRGRVLVGGLTTTFHTAGFVWDDGEVVRLPPGDDSDVDPVAMNDRGQVVGTRRAPDPFAPTIPTLWER